jgi:hypothetical protein
LTTTSSFNFTSPNMSLVSSMPSHNSSGVPILPPSPESRSPLTPASSYSAHSNTSNSIGGIPLTQSQTIKNERDL